ncbi:caspase-3-like [Ornithodoros turicata]|uniref:caspase-3-like n=1 Tax=Ornithodoros turicata TaxID=34597 RepID=UPI003139949A
MALSRDAHPSDEKLFLEKRSIATPQYSEGPRRSTGLDARYELSSTVRDARKNICLIINIVKFQGPIEDRKGASKDAERMHKLFDDLGFQCKLATKVGAVDYESKEGRKYTARDHELTDSDIKKSIQDVKDGMDPKSDIFVCWIMSHGERGHIYDSKGPRISLEEIIKEFAGNSCATLKGKPKLFFVQACQTVKNEEKEDKNDNKTRDTEQKERTPSVLNEKEDRWVYGITPYKDIYVGIATAPGYVSHRDECQGSFYTEAMDEVFRSSLEGRDSVELTRVMTLVRNNVALKYGVKREGDQKEGAKSEMDQRELMQMPCCTFTLTKRLFLSKAASRTAV